MSQPNSLMLFAAGFGTRMGELTKDRPKPLIPVSGITLLDRALNWVVDADIANTVVNIHYKGNLIKETVKDRAQISDETNAVLETGGGLKKALPLLGSDPIYTFNPDVVWSGPNPLTELANAWNPEKMDALLLLIPPSHAHSYTGDGDFSLDAAQRISRGAGYVYSGAQIIKTDGLAHIEQTAFSLNVLWDEMIKTQRVYGLPYTGKWCDVGTPEGITTAEKMLEETHV
ncbi:nucleotidyltransferase family protein [Cochlodiniinecator piscidefendens]|uniref:nucleotidyltransferase family protein n=1 Tax=Cochlodiniinecator piscidefendens TaxID=2715756 RepID=UPI00140A012B|nr:nucleotidyltransferase family protein [Cochlodiniinecator piscidefendens]